MLIDECNKLIDWSCTSGSEQCIYLGDNIWAIKTGFGVGLVKAENYNDAYNQYLASLERMAKTLGDNT